VLVDGVARFERPLLRVVANGGRMVDETGAIAWTRLDHGHVW